ncbi:hypothetical protein EJB05_49770, partial [Eragrostis curvula]
MEVQVREAFLSAVFILILGCLARLVHKWRNPSYSGKLPPGSMGLPIVGETFQLFKSSPSLDIPGFYKLRLKRYGSLFKTSLLGKPVVVSMDMEVNNFIFREDDKLFQLWYPDTMNSIFGKKTVAAGYGPIHKYVRSIAGPIFAPTNLKETFIYETERIMAESLREWATKPSIEVKEAVTNMMFGLIVKALIGFDPKSQRSKELRKNIDLFFHGLLSFPIYVPGTKFYRSMQARKYVQRMLKDLLKQRACAPTNQKRDFLDIVVEELKSGKALVDEDFMMDLVAGLIFAGIAFAPTTVTVLMKYLSGDKKVVEALMEEHAAILKDREVLDSGITWEEYKSMKFTGQVINEISRLSSNSPGIFRKALKDVQVNGYTIPAGWLVMISPMAVHLNPELFKDPLTFHPWRWQVRHKCLHNLKKCVSV